MSVAQHSPLVGPVYLQACGIEQLGLINGKNEDDFDKLTALVKHVVGVPVALISIVDVSRDRQFFKSQQGLAEPWSTRRQTPLSHSFCQHVSRCDAMLVVENAIEHPLVSDNLAIRDLGVMAYLGVPIYGAGQECVGALCAIDGKPRPWTASDIKTMESIAACVSDAIFLRTSLTTCRCLHEELQAFTHALSHDLKSPVNSLGTLLSEIRLELSSSAKPDCEDLIETSEKIALRMQNQITGLAEFNRMHSQHHDLQVVSLDEIVFDALCGLRNTIHQLSAEITLAKLPSVMGVRHMLVSLFQNLIENSLKYRDPARRPAIEIRATEIGDRIDVRVCDNGEGIPAAKRETVFDVLSRLHSRNHSEGSGLGLSICRRIANLHGGEIEVEPGQSIGTTIRVRLKGAQP